MGIPSAVASDVFFSSRALRKEAPTRDLYAELTPHGIRVVGLRPKAFRRRAPSRTPTEPRTKATGMTWEQWQEMLASRAQGKRLMTLAEMANEAVFVASERRAA